MTSIQDKESIHLLKNIPIFQGLEYKEYKKIVPLLKFKQYPPDSLIIKEGTQGDSMYIIIKGAVKITKSEDKKEEIFLQVLYAGSYFGEFALIDNMPRSANVIAIEETDIFRLEKKDFDTLLTKNETISYAFYKNCLEETFSRFRNIIANFTFTQHLLAKKSLKLEEINKDLILAKRIQNYFINTELLDRDQNLLAGVRHSYIYKPCIEIGGDFLNVVELKKDTIGIIIADIMGHGITSALGTGVMRSAFSLASRQYGDRPVEMMNFLNTHFMDVISELYATCYYAMIDTGKKKIRMSKAGHHHPLFWKKNLADFVTIEGMGTGLGLIKKAEFGEVEYEFSPGDKILFFTDGIIEQKNRSGAMYGETRLKYLFRKLITSTSENILDHLYRDLEEHAGDGQIEDDITLLLLEF